MFQHITADGEFSIFVQYEGQQHKTHTEQQHRRFRVQQERQ